MTSKVQSLRAFLDARRPGRLGRGGRGERLDAARKGRLDARLARRRSSARSAAASSNSWRSTKRGRCSSPPLRGRWPRSGQRGSSQKAPPERRALPQRPHPTASPPPSPQGGGMTRTTLDIPLGPEIGQCCGGRVEVPIRLVDAALRKSCCRGGGGRGGAAAACLRLRRRPCRPCAGLGVCAAAGACRRRRDAGRRAGRHAGQRSRPG